MLIVNISFGRIIQGYVYDHDEKLPLPSYHIAVLGEKEVETYTDVNGFFEIYVPHNGLVHLRFQNIGFVTMDLIDIPNEPNINIGKVYVHLNSYLRTIEYNTETKVWGQKVKKNGEREPRINPKKMLLSCTNNTEFKIKLTHLFSEVVENKQVSPEYKTQYGLKREEFYYITYNELIKKCN